MGHEPPALVTVNVVEIVAVDLVEARVDGFLRALDFEPQLFECLGANDDLVGSRRALAGFRGRVGCAPYGLRYQAGAQRNDRQRSYVADFHEVVLLSQVDSRKRFALPAGLKHTIS